MTKIYKDVYEEKIYENKKFKENEKIKLKQKLI